MPVNLQLQGIPLKPSHHEQVVVVIPVGRGEPRLTVFKLTLVAKVDGIVTMVIVEFLTLQVCWAGSVEAVDLPC